MPRKNPIEQTCEFCNETYHKMSRTRFCSRSCALYSRHGAKDKTGKDIVKTCVQCGNEWTTKRSSKDRLRKTCSDECEWNRRSEAGASSSPSPAARKRLSERCKGVPLTKEHRAAISKGQTGEKNWRWVDGRSYEKCGYKDYGGEFTKMLKNIIKERDGHECLKCGHDGSEFLLHVHHIDMDKMNNSESNLATVCSSCHSRIHAGSLDNNFTGNTESN